MNRKIPLRLFVLVACLLCSMSAAAQEAYACYTSDNHKLTFYYDKNRQNRPGTTYDLNSGQNDPGWYTDGTCSSVTTVEFNTSFSPANPPSTYRWFCDMENLESVLGLPFLSCSSTTDASYMFYNCKKLTSFNFSQYNLFSSVTKADYMFAGCTSIESIDMSSLYLSSVTSLEGMFLGCSNLRTLDLRSVKTNNAITMDKMFKGCSRLTTLDLSSFTAFRLSRTIEMFNGCTNLNTIYVRSHWNPWDVSSYLSRDMFTGCVNIVGGQGTSYDANHVDVAYAKIDGGPSDPGYFTEKPRDAYAVFTRANTTLTFYYDYERDSRQGFVHDLNEGSNTPSWYTDGHYSEVTQVVFDQSFVNARPTSTYYWFGGMTNLQSINGMEYLNTSCVTNMNYMFYNCSSLTSLDLALFNTAQVTKMYGMFRGCSNLVTIYVGSKWTTSAVTSSSYMFQSCTNLVGGQGTTYNANHINAAYAHIDGGSSNPGYFTECAKEAYTVYTPDNTTLTFYYDELRSLRSGTTYDLNRYHSYPDWYNDDTKSSVTEVVFDPSFAGARPTSAYSWFNGMTNLTAITGISNLNTSEISILAFMFSRCGQLTSLDLSHFNTDNVTDMSRVFYLSNFTSLDLSSFNTSNVTDMSYMFYGCDKLTSLDVTYFNTSNVTSMANIFGNCRSLTSLDLSSFNTSNVTNMQYMFYYCPGLTSLDLSNFNTSNVTSMEDMFSKCLGLTSLDLSSFNTANVNNMSGMFAMSSNLTTIYVGDGWSTDAVTSSAGMFHLSPSLVGGMGTTYDANHVDKAYAHIDGGTANPGYFTAAGAQPWTDPEPYACYTPSDSTLTFYYDNQRSSRAGTTYDLNEDDNPPEWIGLSYQNEYITHVVFDPSFADARPTSTYAWFLSMSKLETITGMEYLNTAAVTNMFMMFNGCNKLSSLDVSHFNTSKVTNMVAMFMGCSSLTSLDVTNFDTYKVTSDFGMYAMFRDCSGLTNLDLSSFNTSRVKDMREMFKGCSNLVTIYAGDNWTTVAVTNSTDMFTGCTSLVGGQGTTYDANHLDAEYAHIDGGIANPGYFTAEGAQPWTEPEPYACYTPSNTTLTFYYDNQRSSRAGTTYDLNTGTSSPAWYGNGGINSSVTNVVFDPSFADARPTSTVSWFNSMANLDSITGIEYLNTSEVTFMSLMFGSCSALTSLDLSYFNTSNVTHMKSMFYGCSNLTSLDLSSFNTSNVKDMSYMFQNCGVTSLDLSGFNTANVTLMNQMFRSCTSLTSLDLSSFNTANVTNLSYMFYQCSGLTSLDLSSFNTANVTNMASMFYQCSNLTTVYVGAGWNTDAVTSSTNMFYRCYALVGGVGTAYNSSNPMDKTYAHIDGGTSNPGYFTDPNAPAEPEAYVCYTSSNATLTFYYDKLRGNREGRTYDLNEGNVEPGWNGIVYSIDSMVIDPSFADARPTSTSFWFSKHPSSIVGLNYLNTSEVTDMSGMFMFCSQLTSLDLSHFNTDKVTKMMYMFYCCHSMESLDLSNFNTENVTDMQQMFYSCDSLTSVDLRSFNTAKVTDMSWMFDECINLTTLDLSSFNTANVESMHDMFHDCYNLATIYAGDGWNTDAVISSYNMFQYCESLVGGQGTTYDADHVGAAYAHIDGGPSNPGYFTDINATADPVAYVHYNPDNTTLTFYFNSQRGNRDGTSYYLNEGFDDPAWFLDGSYKSVTQVVFDPSFADARPTSTCSWFWGMTNLRSITGLEYLNTSDVTTMWGMFTSCSSLTTIDASSFNTANVTNALSMFDGCSNLTTIYGGDGWNTNSMSVSSYMFKNCVKLVGGKGTTYDANHTDKYYARIDGGPSSPGYFTEKVDFTRGDVNGDGQVKIGDVTALINYLLSGDASDINLQAADCNEDGQIKIGDVTELINYLLSGTW